MKPAAERGRSWLGGFRSRLVVAMMLVVSTVTVAALVYSQRNVSATARREFEQQFRAEIATLNAIHEVRHAALAEHCRALARKPRIHAALEDDALDLLYLSSRDELPDVMRGAEPDTAEASAVFHADFYRFLDGRGAVLSPATTTDVGALAPEESARLALPYAPTRAQSGYVWRAGPGGAPELEEVLAMPITSSETGLPIAALVLGFKPWYLTRSRADAAIKSGLWTDGRLHLEGLPSAERDAVAARLRDTLARLHAEEASFTVNLGGGPYLLFCKLLNPGSLFPPAYEVCLYPLAEAAAHQRRLAWQFAGAGLLLLACAYLASSYLSRRLAVPVEKLVVDSEQDREGRVRAEAALELTSEELQRSARFSADASHQLKTPVTVLRTGLEEMLAGEKLNPEMREEVSALVHQTFRLTSVIEDLLLLSRMDAGRLQLELRPVDLVPLIAGWLDDLGAMSDTEDIDVRTSLPASLFVEGEPTYTTLILQNLIENARKYNRPGGSIRVEAREEGEWAVLIIGNTGPAIPPEAQPHLFERFHRGAMGENIPGHGLGLNLARELARLHRGSLRLTRSDAAWTEFELRFRLARTPAPSA